MERCCTGNLLLCEPPLFGLPFGDVSWRRRAGADLFGAIRAETVGIEVVGVIVVPASGASCWVGPGLSHHLFSLVDLGCIPGCYVGCVGWGSSKIGGVTVQREVSDDAARSAQKTDPVLQNLLSVDDPDWAKFQADDPEWFLRVAGRSIRKFCGWHVFPNIREHVTKLETGAQGIIMLPSRHVTEVDRLTVSTGDRGQQRGVHRDAFEWFEAGYLQMRGSHFWADWFAGGYYYGTDPYYLPVTQPGVAACTFWHGYHVLPEDVKEVAYELATQSMTMKAGNVSMLATPGEYRLQLSQDAGLTLNKDQMNRLGSYRIGMLA